MLNAKAKRLAIVPARGGSKRLPGKNVRDFCGKPMIAHVLDTARASGLFEEIHVSTESPEVSAIAARCGYPAPFVRPAELADDDTPLVPVLRYVIEEYARRGRHFGQVALLYACAPLLEAEDLRGAFELFERLGGAKVVLGVTSFPVPVEWAYALGADNRLLPVQPGMFAQRSQDLGVKVHDAGVLALFPVARLLSDQPHDERDFHGYLLPRHRAVDIDNQEDWEMAERLYRGRRERP